VRAHARVQYLVADIDTDELRQLCLLASLHCVPASRSSLVLSRPPNGRRSLLQRVRDRIKQAPRAAPMARQDAVAASSELTEV
jgi:hypothetical protein